MTWSADTDIDAEDSLARTALSAYSDAAVARGDSAITSYSGLRTIAQTRILSDLSGRDITSDMVTNTSVMIPVEVECALWKLYDAVAQWTDPTRDVYAQRAAKYEARYRASVSAVNPVLSVRGRGASFSWGRG